MPGTNAGASLAEHRQGSEGPGSPVPDDLVRFSVGIEAAEDRRGNRGDDPSIALRRLAARRGGGGPNRRRTGRVRPLLPHLLDLPRAPRPVPGGPLRPSGAPRKRLRTATPRPPCPHRGRPRLADGSSGRSWTGTSWRRPRTAAPEPSRWTSGPSGALPASRCKSWPTRRIETASAPSG